MTARLTLTVVLGCCLCLCLVSCAERPASPAASAEKASLEKTNWYVASREPLTLCPKGYSLPGPEDGRTMAEYVYLGDRKTRFFIPSGASTMRFREEALAAREVSLGFGQRLNRSMKTTGERLFALTVLTPVIAGAAVANTAGQVFRNGAPY